MDEASRRYYDIRSEFWRRHFEMAQDYETYLRSGDPEKARKWREVAQRLPPLSEEQQARLRGYHRRMNVLVHSGIWCGDCVRQGPMLQRIAEACGDEVALRFLERGASDALTDELRMVGGARVPVVVFLSEDFFEIGRFGDRMLPIYRLKAQRELGPACDAGFLPPPPDVLAAEQEEWVSIFERMWLMLRLAPMYRERYGD
jgi:hypothetical protein